MNLETILRIGFFVAAMGAGAGSLYLAANVGAAAATVAAALCILLCVFVFLSRFKRFKGFGVEGELWEQEMEEAAELRRGLKDLSERLGESVYWNLGEGARWASGDPKKIFGIVARTDRNMETMGVARPDIEELKRPWHKCVMRDLAVPITERIAAAIAEKRKVVDDQMSAFGGKIPGDKTKEYGELAETRGAIQKTADDSNKRIWRDDFETVPRLLREAIDENPWLKQEDREAIYQDCAEEFRDIDQYADNRSVRRPTVLKL